MQSTDCDHVDVFRPKVYIEKRNPHRGRPSMDHPELSKARQVILDGEKDLKRYADEIRRFRSEILLLEQKSTQLEECLGHYSSLVAPIWMIPDDVLILIFEYLCVEHANLQKIQGDAPSVLQLSAVCSHWRSVLQFSPSLWTDIVVSFNAEGMPQLETVQLFLERSKEKLLTLDIDIEHGDDAMRLQEIIGCPAFLAIASQAHRWASLELRVHRPEDLCILRAPIIASCPELQTLELVQLCGDEQAQTAILDFVPMPKLTDFLGEYFDPFHPTHNLPWHQLTRLVIDATYDIPRLVELCENLLDLSVRMDSCDWDFDDMVYQPMLTAHQNVQYLTLLLSSSDQEDPVPIERLLEALSLPQLTRLEIINYTAHMDEPTVFNCSSGMLNSFINKCSCTLDRIAFYHISISDIDLTTFLRNTPSLTSISIQDPEKFLTSVSFPLIHCFY
ncbi:hypothetical protein BT96DRAFT_1011204, partial [Gymnopus androsaceus JB14]